MIIGTEDCAARATVVLTRSRSFTVVLSPLDMFGLVGMAQTLGAYTNVMGMATPRYHTLSLPEEYDEMAVIRTLSISSAPDWCQLPLSVVRFHLDEQDKTTIHRTRLHLILSLARLTASETERGTLASSHLGASIVPSHGNSCLMVLCILCSCMDMHRTSANSRPIW